MKKNSPENAALKSRPQHKNGGKKKCYENIGRKSRGGRRHVRVATSLDFTLGPTRIEHRYCVHNQTVCNIVQKVLHDESPHKNDVFFKCAQNWTGEIQKGLVGNTNGEFFVHYEGKGTFIKTVSQKDRHIYHDAYRILAPRLVYCSFVKNHPGLQGESESDYKICHINGRHYDMNIDNLELKKLRKVV